VAATFIATPGTEPALADAAFRADVIERIAALHRIGEPMEGAGAVVFLASPAASLLTGRDNPHRRRLDGAVVENAAVLPFGAPGGGAERRCRAGDPRRHWA
jgi:NAD(P)-dependent dehydrogenase (short-subunit alcohol dehydrogenase family)